MSSIVICSPGAQQINVLEIQIPKSQVSEGLDDVGVRFGLRCHSPRDFHAPTPKERYSRKSHGVKTTRLTCTNVLSGVSGDGYQLVCRFDQKAPRHIDLKFARLKVR